MAKIIIIEDDLMVGSTLRAALLADEHVVDVSRDGESGLSFVQSIEYDVIILDWQLPLLDGISVCRRYRSGGGQTPIIMLTAKDSIADKEMGFDCGADDYLTKPFDIRELKARIRGLLRRPVLHTANIIIVGNISIDTRNRQVKREGVEVSLQDNEYALLEFFVRHPNELISPETLLRRVWDTDSEASLHAVYTCVARLRKKLDSTTKDSLIRTVYGSGYRLIPPEVLAV